MGKVFSALGRLIDVLRTWIGRLVFVVVLIFLGVLIFSSPAGVEVPERAALVWAPSGMITEQRQSVSPADLFISGSTPLSTNLQDLLDALELAAEDTRIQALVIDVSELLSVSPAHLETLGDALGRFRDTGKPVYSYGEYYSQAQYALASYADSVTLHPMGNLLLTGFGGSQLFFRDVLDRLNINVHIFRVGEFKSASEPFTRMDMSDEARADSQTLVDVLWTRYLQRVAPNRALEPEQLQAYADNYDANLQQAGGDMARVAFEQGLVDNIAAIDSFRRQVAAVVGVDNGSFSQIHHRDYLQAARTVLIPSVDQVGVIVAQGTIMPGPQLAGVMGADDISNLIRLAQRDPAVKALVLRIDSPGGSALASEQIRGALQQFQQTGKPVVVSMAGTAASGGYWIAATADQIWASPSTITGSIGVVAMVPTFERALSAVGVGVDGVGTTVLSRGADPLSGLNETTERILQANVEDTYERFINLVAQGRDMTAAEVEALAQGRVWSGEQAYELGLVDELGDLDQALDAAAGLAGLETYQRVYIERPLTFGEQLLSQMVDNMGSVRVLNGGLLGGSAITGTAMARLPVLSASQQQYWQSLVELILPADSSLARPRTLSVCESCFSFY